MQRANKVPLGLESKAQLLCQPGMLKTGAQFEQINNA